MSEDFTRVVGAILAEDGSIEKLILEQEDHKQHEVALSSGTSPGVGDSLYIYGYPAGASIAISDSDLSGPADLNDNNLDGGTSFSFDLTTGAVTVLEDCVVDGAAILTWDEVYDATPPRISITSSPRHGTGHEMLRFGEVPTVQGLTRAFLPVLHPMRCAAGSVILLRALKLSGTDTISVNGWELALTRIA